MNDVIINFFSLFKDFPQSKAIQSIKVKNKSFSFDRYGVEIDKKTITLNQVENILNKFLCALDKDEISDQYEKCSHICFALELDDKINYRIYFRRNYNFNSFDFSAESFIAYYSYKWDADNNLKILETNYEIFRNLDSNCILKKIKETKLFLPNFIEKLLKENDIIRNSHLSRKNNYLNNDFLYESLNNQCILSIICDSSSSRKSYNISHPAISVLKLSKEIEEIFNLEIKNIFAQFKDKKIDDITIGIDKHKENFMTFYFEDEKIIDYLKKFNII